MKTGLASSLFAHAGLLAWGMVSLAAPPPPLTVAEVEALPVDIVPIETLTKTVKGDKKAKPSKTPAPKPTKSPPKPIKAVNAGDTKNDTKAEAKEITKAPPVEKTEAPAPKPKPAPAKKQTAAPTPKLAPKPKPKTDIAMLLKKSADVTPEKPVEDAFEKLPKKVSPPKKRPEKPKPEAAETDKREDTKEVTSAKTETKDAKPTKSKESKKAKPKKTSDAKKKATVNKAKANAGGAKSSKKKASLGAKKSNNNSKLSQSEIDAVRGRLEGCWNVGDLTGHPDADKMRARATFKLTKSGDLDGRVKVKVSGTDKRTKRTLAVRVRSAIKECAPYQLPQEKYETWADVVVNFSLADML